MGLSVNNDLVNLSDNFESLKTKIEAIEIIVYGEKVLELDDSTCQFRYAGRGRSLQEIRVHEIFCF